MATNNKSSVLLAKLDSAQLPFECGTTSQPKHLSNFDKSRVTNDLESTKTRRRKDSKGIDLKKAQ